MKPNRRAGLKLFGVAVALGALMWALSSRPSQVLEETTEEAAAEPAPEVHAAQKTSGPRVAAASSLAGQAAPSPILGVPGEEKARSPECKQCRQTECTNYRGLGVDLIKGCFAEIDPSLGADSHDKRFLDDCTAAVTCASRHGCATGPHGAAGCYCGSRSIDECAEQGPGPDAPCAEEWRRATRTRDRDELNVRFSDFKYPSGWATFMIECDQQLCKTQCT